MNEKKKDATEIKMSQLKLKAIEIFGKIWNAGTILLLIYIAWTIRNDSWFWPLLVLGLLFLPRFYEIDKKITVMEEMNKDIEGYMYKKKYYDLNINLDHYGFILQNITMFSFEPDIGLIKKIAKLIKRNETDIEKSVFEIKKVAITINNYTNDLRVIRTVWITRKDEKRTNEWVDFPKDKHYDYTSQVGWAGDVILFSWGAMGIYLDMMAEGGTKIVVAISDPDSLINKDIVLFEAPLSGKGLKKYSLYPDDAAHKEIWREYRSYSNIYQEEIQDFYWHLNMVTHSVIVDYMKKHDEWEKEYENEKAKKNTKEEAKIT
ncbi:MAG: hypothetical protein JW873_00295 [Candidatus Saganbacteria bacterium]|nr:hypothetical protein [Candidatus Saganbacteria bacterium]